MSDEVRYGPEGQVVIDHLDLSDSPTVRRHAATFRRARTRLSDAEGEGASGGVGVDGSVGRRGYVDGTAADVDGDGLRVLGARSAASVAEVAATNGWGVLRRFASHRRESDGAPMDAVVVAVHQGDPKALDRWAVAHWRTEALSPPMKRKWKFSGATAWSRTGGVRVVGARELNALIVSPISDALECDHVPLDRGGEDPDGEGRS